MRLTHVAVLPAVLAIVLAAGAPAALAQPAPTPAPTPTAKAPEPQVPIRRITMYRSGVASFERAGPVTGNTRLQFRFNTGQINDILQSMFVLDLSKGQGRIDGISYGSKEPLAKRLASFGVDIADNPPAGEVLARLRGTPVRLFLPSGEVSGTIMNVENRQTVYPGTSGTSTAVHSLPWINLITPAGVRSFNLTETKGFEILDPALAGELSKALAALAEYRADRTKTVDVNLSGEGTRDVVVGYVQEAPVWKTSYRLVLPSSKPPEGAKSDRFTIQGWAIVENTTDEDWRDVTLSLVSGRPVSFRMDLYEPLYVERPQVPVPTVPGVAPRMYEGGVADPSRKDAGRPMPATGAPGRPGARGGGGELDTLKYEARAYAAKPAATSATLEAGYLGVSSDDMASYSARAQAAAVENGEVFAFQLDHPVTVERQRSAMLPIIASGIEGRRVSIYNPSDGSTHPMRGVEITNSTGLQLMPGPISVYDDGVYAGDAQVGHLPKGDKRLLAYSVDLEMDIARTDLSQEEIRQVRIVKGLIEVTSKVRQTTTFACTNKDLARPRDLIIEFPRMGGWDLPADIKPAETTEQLYRFESTVEPGKSATRQVVLEHVNQSSIALTQMDQETLLSYAKAGKVSDAVVNAFREAARRQGVISRLASESAALAKERQEIEADQARIRQNMATNTIDRQSELFTRYIRKLTEQETRLEAIATATAKNRDDAAKAQADLNDYIANLSVE